MSERTMQFAAMPDELAEALGMRRRAPTEAATPETVIKSFENEIVLRERSAVREKQRAAYQREAVALLRESSDVRRYVTLCGFIESQDCGVPEVETLHESCTDLACPVHGAGNIVRG
jgi:hypothetical protein